MQATNGPSTVLRDHITMRQSRRHRRLPSACPAEEGSEPLLPSFGFSFANVISWNQSVQQFFLESGRRCFLVQEHRLLAPAFQRLQSNLKLKSFHVTGVAVKETEKGGTSGGVFLAMHHSLQIQSGCHCGSGPCWAAAWIWLAKVRLVLVSIYLKDGEVFVVTQIVACCKSCLSCLLS